MKVAFQGTRGAYSEMALKKFFSHHDNIEVHGFDLSEHVCEAVRDGEVDYGILPVENSIVGSVTINIDMFYEYQIYAIGEVYLRINHCLLGLPGAKTEEIKKVYSHPIALGQCRDFLTRHKIESEYFYDTAGAAKMLFEKQDSQLGTISSSLCSEIYGLNIIEEGIQKVKENITRFLVFVDKHKVIPDVRKEKTSLAFSTKHHPGALLNCLQSFASHNINLTKLESRPIIENPFEYIFFVDFSSSIDDKNVKDCLNELEKDAKDIKILGSYPKNPSI
ncbi:MAG: prephenate dehydratase [Halobacteriovoraceae bacterium]|nr:prephenate dehydratase [Halobacteriovoraceae bacterium]